jgi:hypothetical protein
MSSSTKERYFWRNCVMSIFHTSRVMHLRSIIYSLCNTSSVTEILRVYAEIALQSRFSIILFFWSCKHATDDNFSVLNRELTTYLWLHYTQIDIFLWLFVYAEKIEEECGSEGCEESRLPDDMLGG